MKKPSIIAFLITFLFAAAVCTQEKEADLITDTDGNPLDVKKLYFIQPVRTASNNGGGLVPAPISVRHVCPLGITQTLLPFQPGLPVSFSYPFGLEVPITSYIDVNIEFKSDIWPVCSEYSKLWKVDDSLSASKEPALVIGGERMEPNSWFKFEKAGENTYRLTTIYGTVASSPSAWLRAPKLVVTNDKSKALLVKIKKAEDATTTTTSTSRVDKLGLRMFPF